MASALKIPDLRFEQSFIRSLHANSAKTKSGNNLQAEAEGQVNPLPVEITPAIVIYTIIKDQVLMPFAQGLMMTSLLLMFKPILYKFFENGRNFGLRLFNGLGLTRNGVKVYNRNGFKTI